MSAQLNGGNFGNGFVTSLASSYLGGKLRDSTSSTILRIAGASIIGGTASKVTGGKFVSGAATGAFSAVVSAGLGGGSDSEHVCHEVSKCKGPLNAEHEFKKKNEGLELVVTTDEKGVNVIKGTVTVSGDHAETAAEQINKHWGSGKTRKYNGQKYRTEITAEVVESGGQIEIRQLNDSQIAQAKQSYIAKVLNCDPSRVITPDGFQIGGRAALGGNYIEVGDGAGKYTYAHEFGHVMGLGHAPNSTRTGSIMSYSARRRVQGRDIHNLVNGYR